MSTVASEQSPLTPAGQDSVVPLGWKRSPGAPIPVMRCSHIFKDADKHGRAGERCNRWSLRGYHKCWSHSGQGHLENVNTFKQNIVEASYLRYYGTLEEATDWLIDLAENATSEAVRLKAIENIHAMCGMKSGTDVNINVNVADDPAQLLRERIISLHKRTVDAEILSSTTEIEAPPPAPDKVSPSPETEESQ